jgi:hypothetical protein
MRVFAGVFIPVVAESNMGTGTVRPHEGGPSSGLLRRVVWYKFTDVSEVLATSIIWATALIMDVLFYFSEGLIEAC